MEAILDTTNPMQAFLQGLKVSLENAKQTLGTEDYAELLDELADECEQRILKTEV